MKNNIKLISYCASYCDLCPQYLKINKKGKRFCNGCKSTTPGFKGFCKTCSIKACCTAKKIKYCYQCAIYPCQRLIRHRNLQIGNPKRCYRHTLFERMMVLKKLGATDFLKEIGKNKYCLDRLNSHIKCVHKKLAIDNIN